VGTFIAYRDKGGGFVSLEVCNVLDVLTSWVVNYMTQGEGLAMLLMNFACHGVGMRKSATFIAMGSIVSGCIGGATTFTPQITSIPAIEFADATRQESPAVYTQSYQGYVAVRNAKRITQNKVPMVDATSPEARAQLRFAQHGQDIPHKGMISNMGSYSEDFSGVNARVRPYEGPLALGNPGQSPSLFQESRRATDLFSDRRAWQPLDVITIVVQEQTLATKQADTEVTGQSNVTLGIPNLLGFETEAVSKNSGLNPASLINATSVNNFIGESDTSRSGNLTARISAVVMEVLPGGLLRIEGEKIIAVNSEEEVMVISGVVRPRDINSLNEVGSDKVAQLRVDYYGNGIMGESQRGNWFARLLRVIWPF